MIALVIPPALQDAILRKRAHFRELNAKAQAYNAARQAESNGAESIQVGFVTKPDELGPERQFWNLAADEALEDFLFDDLLAALDLDTDWTTLPRGYPPLLDVLEFERHCQFEGWTAVSNKGTEEMRRIVESYACVGLSDEARALAAVTDAYSRLPNPDVAEFHDILRKAYIAAHDGNTDFDDRIENRLPRIFQFVRSHPDWFGVPG